MEKNGIESEPLRRRLSIRVSLIARLLRMRFDKRVESTGVTRAQWGMIALVAGRQGATQREIAMLLEQSEASAGRVIDRLCNEGMLERRQKEDDRRAYAIYLTEKSRPMIDSLERHAEKFEAEAFNGFSEEELAMLDRLLIKMQDNR